MRKKINTVTLILYFVSFLGAIFFGWYDVKTIGSSFRAWPICLTLLGCMLVIGIIRSILLKIDNNNMFVDQTPTRVVTINETKIIGNVFNINATATDLLPLVHVDSVEEKEIIVKVYKEKVLLSDSVSKIVNQ